MLCTQKQKAISFSFFFDRNASPASEHNNLISEYETHAKTSLAAIRPAIISVHSPSHVGGLLSSPTTFPTSQSLPTILLHWSSQ
jgi:hypothetical protein